MLLKNKNIAIIGGGPGGLTLARLLQLKGANVKVYERDFNREVRVQGATLDLHAETGLKALDEAALMDAFKANYRPDNDKLRVLDEDLNIIYDQHAEIDSVDFGHEHFRPEIDRGPLRDILLDSLKPDTVVWNSHIISLESVDQSWKITFQNGSTAIADIVIGADGANSKIRKYVTPIKPFYTGVTVLIGNIPFSEKNAPTLHELLKGGKVMALGASKTISLSEKGDGSLDFYIGYHKDENWSVTSGIDFNDNAQVLNWFKDEFAGWNSDWHELFATEGVMFIPRPLYCMPLDQTWDAQPNITIIGDAAHLMPPYAGEGVNMAMLDALQLSESLSDNRFTSLRSAIANYEKQMFVRFSEMGKITLDNTDAMHSSEGKESLLKIIGLAQNDDHSK
ncbi:2-polyprenyl-6-methoxyphenol hydroxylase [Mucilaginibacter pineti]|uniref:Flavin-dependent monooxygenase n=2 Tax=Mucilaginibacter pineti TaxID=1391627 RepID=A0A1G7JJI2_9SPHI|nr:2-polyprenyl-6-methoxyphenol hydroxylase [Mucilaginibacter pineti]